MKFKNCAAKVMADIPAGGTDDGAFEAIVSVFGNVDAYKDVVMPGAFAESLAAWKFSGDPTPVWWSHRMDDPEMNIGVLDDTDELAPADPRIPEWADQWVKDHGGLWVRGHVDVGPDASPKAIAARKLMLKRRVTQFSFAYDVVEEFRNEAGHNELRKLRLHEVSLTPIGANELTELISAKAAQFKVGRVLSEVNETRVREAVKLLTEMLAELDGDAAESEPAKREEPERVKREEPARMDADAVRQLIDLTEYACLAPATG